MIARDEVMPLLLEACPSFREPWKAYLAAADYEEVLLYIDLGEFARHLVGLLRRGEASEFPAVFQVVERLHLEGDSFVTEAVTIGLLEGIQIAAANTGLDPENFAAHLMPESAKWWSELNAFWDGKGPYVGAGLQSRK